MPAAELLKPRSLTAYGRRWERGVKVNVSEATADLLEDDERFQIKRSQKAVEEVAHLPEYDIPSNRPAVRQTAQTADPEPLVEDPDEGAENPTGLTGKALYHAIREVVDDVDVDNDDNFDANGRPTAAAISALLETEVTEEDVAKALDVSQNAKEIAAAAAGNRDMADEQKVLRHEAPAKTKPAAVRIKSPKAKHAGETAPGPAPEKTASGNTPDPSTAGAIEV